VAADTEQEHCAANDLKPVPVQAVRTSQPSAATRQHDPHRGEEPVCEVLPIAPATSYEHRARQPAASRDTRGCARHVMGLAQAMPLAPAMPLTCRVAHRRDRRVDAAR
jgi:hypothetical protein